MIKTLLTVAVIGSVGSFAGLALAQGKRGETFGSDVSSLLEKLEAQCAHRRRTMPPDSRDGCNLRSDAQFHSGQGGSSASSSHASGSGPAVGPGNAGGQGNGIGPGSGGGQAKGRR